MYGTKSLFYQYYCIHDGRGGAKAVRNIYNFEKILKRGRLLEGEGLVSNKVGFGMEVGPDREQVHITNDFLMLGYL